MKVRHEIKSILAKSEITTVIVTHDSQDAFNLADKIAILKGGIIQQVGSPKELYHQPVSPYVARFFGEISMIKGTKSEKGISTAFGTIHKAIENQDVLIGLRPGAVNIVSKEENLKGVISQVRFLGEFYEYMVTTESSDEHIHIRSLDEKYNVGDAICFSINTDQIRIF